MTDIKPNESKDEEKNVPTPTNLDEVHEKTIFDLDNEVANEDDKEVVETDEDDNKDDKEVVDKPVDKPVEPTEQKPSVEVPTPSKEEPVVVPAVEDEIPKIKIKDSEGKEIEVATIDDIPDDFEPYSYKEYAVAVNKLTVLGIERTQTEKQKAIDAEKADRDARIDKIKAGWQADQDALIKEGLLDGDATKNTPVIDGVFSLMQEEMNNNGTTLGFRQAYEMYSYRDSRKQNAEEAKAKNDEKKRRGSMVMGSGSVSQSAPARQGKVFEAPPTGISLDQVHENILGSL